MAGRGAILGLCLAAVTWAGPAVSDESVTLLSFADLDGWPDDDHAAALAVFRNTCADMNGDDWQALCAIADTAPEARTFSNSSFARS